MRSNIVVPATRVRTATQSEMVALQAAPTHDCTPTLDDQQVLDFCTRGFHVLEGAIDAETNARTLQVINPGGVG